MHRWRTDLFRHLLHGLGVELRLEEQRQIDLSAHVGNVGLVEQQTGRPSKKSPAEAGQGILEGRNTPMPSIFPVFCIS
jgi:hypothetical protein